METGGFSKAIQSLAEWVSRLCLVNLQWFFYNAPVFFLGWLLLLADNNQQIMTYVITLLIIAPFSFFPSTVAMVAVVRKWTMKEFDIPIFRSFGNYYKQYYKKSLQAGGILEIFWMIFIVDYYYVVENISQSLALVFIIIAVIALMMSVFSLANIVHYDIRLMSSFKNAFIMVLTNPILSFSVGAFHFFVVYISLSVATFLIPFFTGVVIAFVSFAAFYKVHLKVIALQNIDENIDE